MNETISTYGEQSRTPFDPLEALTVQEAAALLHVSRPTVEKYIKLGELPSVRIGRCRRIRRLDLEAFLDHRTVSGWRRYEPQPPRPANAPAERSGKGADADGNPIPF